MVYHYRAPLDWLAQRLVAATTHPIRSRLPDQPPGLTPQRVTLRWAPTAGGALRTQRGLLWTSHETPLALAGYQRAGAEALVQFRPTRRREGEGRPLVERFTAPVSGPVKAVANLGNDRLTIRGRIGTVPFLRSLAAPGLLAGRWSVQAGEEGRQIRLALGPPNRPPIGARVFVCRGQIEQPTAQVLATGHIAISADLGMEAEWLDNQGRRRVTDWTIPVRHLLSLPEASPSEILGVNLLLEDLRWAPDGPAWALLRAQIARYRPTFLPVNRWHSVQTEAAPPSMGYTPAPVLVGYIETSFSWTEDSQPLATVPVEPFEVAFGRPVSRLLALDSRPGALDLLLGLKGGGLHLLTVPTSWTSAPRSLTALAFSDRLRFQA
jgi:hypothetical protein